MVLSKYGLKQISDPAAASAVHAYFDLFTENPSGELVTYFAFDGHRPGPGRVMVCTRDGTDHREVGLAPYGSANGGARRRSASDDQVSYQLVGEDGTSTVITSVGDGSDQVVPVAIRMWHAPSKRALCPSKDVSGASHGEESVSVLDLATGESRVLFTWDDALALHPLRDEIMAMDPKDQAIIQFKHTKWSPDGSMFFAVFYNAPWWRKHRRGVYVKSLFLANADGGELRYLREFGHHPLWLPDGSAVHSFERLPDGGQKMMAHPVDGSGPYVIFDQAPGVHPSFSPDGRYVTTDRFRHPELGQGQVLLYDVATQEPEVLATFATPDTTHETGVHPHPAWSREGTRIYFSMAEENVPHLYAIDLT